MIPLTEVLNSLHELDVDDLQKLTLAVDNLRAGRINQSILNSDNVQDEYPQLSIPLEYTPPFLENTFIMFLEEVTKNYKKDYSFSDPNEITNDLSVIIKSHYSQQDLKDGQFPKVSVKCDSMRISNTSISDTDVKGVEFLDAGNITEAHHKHVWMNFNIYFDVISPMDTECDILATKYAMHLTQSKMTLKKLGNLFHIDYPSVSYAQKTREYGDLFLSRVSFSVQKEMKWVEIVKLENYNNYITKLVAVCKRRPECLGFEQFLYAGFDQDSVNVSQYLNHLDENKEVGDNC